MSSSTTAARPSVNHPIPIDQWEWQGHAAHFCGADKCRFRLCTVVGNVIVSTVGDYHPVGIDGRSGGICALSSNPQSFFETMVFRAYPGREACGCRLASGNPVETKYWPTAREAQEGHPSLCRKYAGLDR